MRKGEKKPPREESRAPMEMIIGVRLDEEARIALAKIEAVVSATGVRSARSVAVRRALIETAARLDAAPPTGK